MQLCVRHIIRKKVSFYRIIFLPIYIMYHRFGMGEWLETGEQINELKLRAGME